MGSLYENIEQFGKNAGYKNMTILCKAAGVPRTTMSELNAGRSKDLSKPNAQKFADLLELSLDDIYDIKQKERAPTLTKKDERDIARDLESIMDDLTQDGTLMFDGDPMTDEAKESIMAAMKLGLQAAKLKNKARFTPKKYRKE